MLTCWQLLVILLPAASSFVHPKKYQSSELHNDAVIPLSELQRTSYDTLLQSIIPSSAHIVLIGEGTHGTEEFFRTRSELTKQLVQRCGFDAVICEGDVRPFFKLNKLSAATDNIRDNLGEIFESHFPDWMWNNVPMSEFVSWMKKRSQQQLPKLLLIGMDIQSPFDSIDYITQQLLEMDEIELATVAKERYATLNSFRPNIRRYGDAVYANRVPSQESGVQEVVNALSERFGDNYDSITFELLQNARAVAASETYHRQRILPGHTAAWNKRSEAFMDCILRSREYVSHAKQRESCCNQESNPSKIIIWAHNSHIGDMRSTGYASLGQVSVGQLCREMFGKEGVFLIGFTSYEGTVRAAHTDRRGACFEGKGEVLVLNKGLEDSHEAHLHDIVINMKQEIGEAAFGLNLRNTDHNIVSSFDCNCFERFIGSCYLPQTEMMSHYTRCNLANQFDFLFHVDKSSAITV